MMYNRVCLAGNLTRDPELKPAGSSQVAKFSIAINNRYKTKSGEQKEDTEFVDLEAWGKTAEFVSSYFTKGSPIFIEGKLKTDAYEDKNGNKVRKTKVVVENVVFVGGKKKEETYTQVDPSASLGAAINKAL